MDKLPDVDWEPWFKWEPPLLQIPPFMLAVENGVGIVPEPSLTLGALLALAAVAIHRKYTGRRPERET